VGLQRGENFWLRLNTVSAQCLGLSERFFHLHYRRATSLSRLLETGTVAVTQTALPRCTATLRRCVPQNQLHKIGTKCAVRKPFSSQFARWRLCYISRQRAAEDAENRSRAPFVGFRPTESDDVRTLAGRSAAASALCMGACGGACARRCLSIRSRCAVTASARPTRPRFNSSTASQSTTANSRSSKVCL